MDGWLSDPPQRICFTESDALYIVRAVKCLLLALGLSACASADTAGAIDAGGGSVDAAMRHDAAPGGDATLAPDAGPIASTCASAMTCQTAQQLGTFSGDTGAGTLSANGYQSAWFRVRVTEDYSDAPGLALRLAAKLTAPAGGGFDTFVYVNATSDTIECSTTLGTVTISGNTKEVRAEWGEGFIPNGADDTRDVTIEVRPTTTSCSAGQTWQLQLDGNWL